MGALVEMMLRNGLIMRDSDGDHYVDGSLLSNSLCIRDSHGWVTHRIERSARGGDELVIRNERTGLVESRISASILR